MFSCVNQWGWGDVKTMVAGLIVDAGTDGLWKLLVGAQTMNGWQVGPPGVNVRVGVNMY